MTALPATRVGAAPTVAPGGELVAEKTLVAETYPVRVEDNYVVIEV